MYKVKAKKSLGQHFLKDEPTAQHIAETLSGEGYNKVLEIGPGMGMLTKYLLDNKDFETWVVELDTESVSYLRAKYLHLSARIISKDFLHLDLDTLFDEPFAIIGNYPYNISSQIVFKILDNPHKIVEFGGMFQKEVAMRFASGPGNRDYGIPSVLLQTFYDVTYQFTVPPEVFDPPPRVESGVIIARLKKDYVLPVSKKLYTDVIKTAFSQRRKMLNNALSKFNIDWVAADCADYAKLRAEKLHFTDFIKITQYLESRKE